MFTITRLEDYNEYRKARGLQPILLPPDEQDKIHKIQLSSNINLLS